MSAELPDRMWDYLGMPADQRVDVVAFLSVAAPVAFDAALNAVREVHAGAGQDRDTAAEAAERRPTCRCGHFELDHLPALPTSACSRCACDMFVYGQRAAVRETGGKP